MPFRSEKQRKKMMELEAQGKLSPGTVARWEAETPKGKLPARVPKAHSKKQRFAKVVK